MFQTVYDDLTIKNIYSFSDIHGDIHSLIIALRDCAKVIKKKKDKEYDLEPKINSPDLDLERLLQIDISINDNDYIDDLNYEWNPIMTNTYVVIIGDIIDATRRGSYFISHEGVLITPSHWYYQVEIKILRFINSLHEQALKFNSKIIKLLGNHEVMNILGYTERIKKYAFKNDITSHDKIYYRDDTRFNTFLPERHGFNLLMKHGAGILVRVNNNIFIHGQLVENITEKDYIDINNNVNSTDFNIVLKALGQINHTTEDGVESPLWAREFGSPDSGESICKKVKQLLQMFIGEEHDITDLRLIIGHCIQSRATMSNQSNRTFSKIDIDASRRIEYLSAPAKTSIPDIKNDFIFGVTMGCPKHLNKNDHHLYRVDIGASRGFDSKRDIDMITTPHVDQTFNELEKRYLYSRTPQVLKLGQTVQIIRSRLKNTRIHQLRVYYEEYIKKHSRKSLPDKGLPDKGSPDKGSLDKSLLDKGSLDKSSLDLSSLDLSSENYYHKYLKYKIKYLKLLK